MTNQQILERAIQKAIDGGWAGGYTKIKPEYWNDPRVGKFYRRQTVDGWSLNPQPIIFNHDFAKALWGEQVMKFLEGGYDKYASKEELAAANFKYRPWNAVEGYMRAWEWHLQQMVISPDPLAYLGKNI